MRAAHRVLLVFLLVSLYGVVSLCQSIERTYRWTHGGRTWTWTIRISRDAYLLFHNLPRVPDLSVYVTTPYHDAPLSGLVAALRRGAAEAGLDQRETAEFVISFVQSVPYAFDWTSKGHNDYPRYPLETLVDGKGDCEDTSILAAALLRGLGCDVVLLFFPRTLAEPGHAAVGVWAEQIPEGVFYRFEGRDYYFLETTGEGWSVGEVPPDHVSRKAHVVKLRPSPYLMIEGVITTYTSGFVRDTYTVTVKVSNYGSATAFNTTAYAAFDAGSSRVWDQAQSQPVDLYPLQNLTFKLQVSVPRGELTRVVVKVWCSTGQQADWISTWFRP